MQVLCMGNTDGGRISQNFLSIFKGFLQLNIYITGFSRAGNKIVKLLRNGELKLFFGGILRLKIL
jgi:hypothetical protein